MKKIIKKILIYFLWDWEKIHNEYKFNMTRREALLRHDIYEIQMQVNGLENRITDFAKDHVTMWIDFCLATEDTTSIIILSRINKQERVEIINKKFATIKELEALIKEIKMSDKWVFRDYPHLLKFNPNYF